MLNHIVVVMLENRSFDSMLGFLYAASQNKSPSGQPFEGLTGSESNTDSKGNTVKVFQLQPNTPNLYLMPGADPGEGYTHTNTELFGTATPPTPPNASCKGFLTDFTATLGTPNHTGVPGTAARNIMGMFTPTTLPVLSALARGYAVCDHWYASVPSETMPNRAFALAATSLGAVSDPKDGPSPTYNTPSIFGALSKKNVSWAVYGYEKPAYTRNNFPDTLSAPDTNFGLFADFKTAVADGKLAAFSFLEPSWGSTGNSQHPNYDVALGEQFIHDVYETLRGGPADQWSSTLLVITYDEHGGCYDHVSPPLGATPPNTSPGEAGFDFKRFGVRVPTVLISPLISKGTVFRAPAGGPPFDHTSVLKTAEKRWDIPPLTHRDGAAPDVAGVLTLTTPRTDDVLAGVVVPSMAGTNPHSPNDPPSHLQQLHAASVANLPVPGGPHAKTPKFVSGAAADDFITKRTHAWIAGKRR